MQTYRRAAVRVGRRTAMGSGFVCTQSKPLYVIGVAHMQGRGWGMNMRPNN